MFLKIGTRNEINRLNWLKKTLSKLPDGVRILDAGAGELAQKQFCKHLNYVSQDFAEYSGQGNGKGLQTGTWDQTQLDIISDITAIPEPDNSFDAIMCIEVFEHIPNPILAIKEFSRLLKKGGYLIISAPFNSLTHFAPFHYYSGFNKYFFEYYLPENGFEIIEYETNGNYFEYLAQELWRLPEIAKKYANTKKGFMQKILIYFMALLLNKYNIKDTGSSELLSFGFQFIARKKN